MDILVQKALHSPNLPEIITELNQAWSNEQRRREAFYNWVTPDIKAEFIEGEIIVHSPVKKRHSWVSNKLNHLLDIFAIKRDLGFVGHEKIMSRFTRNDYEPDISFFFKAKADTVGDGQSIFPVPDFIVEVLSDSTKDRDYDVKFKDYQKHGVGEYWIVDPEEEVVEQYILKQGKYVLQERKRDGIIESVVIPNFKIPVRAMFDKETFIETLNSF
jgi:Uma2 family endonuclease